MRRVAFALWSRVTSLFGGRFEEELDEELQFHLDEATARHVRQGMSWEAAREAARRQLGNLGAAKEAVRDETGVRPLHDVSRDLRMAARQLIQRPAYSALVVLTIATSIAANSAVFSVVHSVLLAPLPFADPDRLVRIFNSYPAMGVQRTGSSAPEYFERRERLTSLEQIALYREESNTIGTAGVSRHAFALRVTPSFFELLGVRAIHGRVLTEQDAEPGAAPVVVLGHDLWRTIFGGRPDAVGGFITLDGTNFRIAGVLPASFRFPTWDAQIVTPLTFGPQSREVRARHGDSFHMLARLNADATISDAENHIAALNAAAVDGYPADLHQRIAASGYTTTIRPYLADLTRDVEQPLRLLWIGGMVVLMIGIANVATLVVLRTRQRTRELAVRAALGAGRGRLARQLIVETSLLAGIGGAIGLVGAQAALRLLTAFETYDIPRVGDVAISPTVIAWAWTSVMCAALFAGVAPALAAVRRQQALTAGTSSRYTRASPWPLRVLVSAQIAFAMVLALTTGLLLSSLRQLEAVERGFDGTNVSVAAIILPGARYPSAQARRDLLQQVLEAIETTPGVKRAAAATQLPFSGNTTRTPFLPNVPGAGVATPFGTTVSDGFFETMGIEVRTGRLLLPSDTHTTESVAVIDETLANRYWPDGAVGQRFWLAAQPEAPESATTIVGVVAAIRQNSLRDTDLPGAVYLPVTQAAPGFMRLAVKHHSAERNWPDVVARIRSVDGALTPFWTDTLAASVDASLTVQRAPTQLLGVFWAIGLLLGVCGVYGVLAWEFSSRRREIAVRVALGGNRTHIVSLIWRQWAMLVGLGLAAGSLAALGAERVVGNLMFQARVSDPGVLLLATGTLLAGAALAAVRPIRQALRVDPALTLRQD